jgi:uncharacterized protein YjbI with pentapeptide repeats
MKTEQLQKILSDHKKWLYRKEGGSRAHLSGADLSGADLGRADLSGADLSGADLRRADLRGAHLSGADLSGADLRRAHLRGADLSGADLGGADLGGAHLGGADLRRAHLSGASLWDCVGNRDHIRSLQLETYSITYTTGIIQIGCKRYTFDEWREFTDEEIIQMDGKTALMFWRKWKDTIFMLIEMAPATPTSKEGSGS